MDVCWNLSLLRFFYQEEYWRDKKKDYPGLHIYMLLPRYSIAFDTGNYE
jgi:hypothetical protein